MNSSIFWVVIVIASTVAAQQQYIQIYNEPNCLGELIANFSGTTINAYIKSISVSFAIDGVWHVKPPCVPRVKQPCISEGSIFSGQGECTNYTSPVTGDLVVHRYGNGDLSTQEIYLFHGSEFNGLDRTITRSQETMGRSGIKLRSYLFTGSQSWTLYSGPNFTGTATCLRPSEEIIQKQYGITFNTNYTQMVNSVRRGCAAKAVPLETSGSTNLHTTFSFLVTIPIVILSQFLH